MNGASSAYPETGTDADNPTESDPYADAIEAADRAYDAAVAKVGIDRDNDIRDAWAHLDTRLEEIDNTLYKALKAVSHEFNRRYAELNREHGGKGGPDNYTYRHALEKLRADRTDGLATAMANYHVDRRTAWRHRDQAVEFAFKAAGEAASQVGRDCDAAYGAAEAAFLNEPGAGEQS